MKDYRVLVDEERLSILGIAAYFEAPFSFSGQLPNGRLCYYSSEQETWFVRIISNAK